ncbi:MAG: UPF0182 family membrane protein [Acidimicrobiales bacterium]
MRRAEPEDASPRRSRRPGRGRSWLLIAGAVVFVVLTSLQAIATFYTDYLWFGTLGLSSVWRGLISVKVGLAVVFSLVFFALMLINLIIADRLAPRFRPMGPEDEIVARYQETVGTHANKVRLGVAALFALIAGSGVSGQWQNWLLYRNAVDFGTKDPQFGRDVGFFIFSLPFITYVIDWLFVALVLVLLMSAVAHYFNGGIRVQAAGQRATPQVKAHLSVLLGLLALVKAADYWYRRFELVYSDRGPVSGASYTDVKAQLPALNLLVVISLAAVLLFVANIWMRGWVLPVIAVATWGLVAVLVGAIYPAFVQKFQVEPDEASKERPYIERNISATRAALRLDNVTERNFDYSTDLTSADLQANQETIKNIRLWDPPVLKDTYKRLQELRDFFRFNDVDVDRYEINGELTQVVLSARDLDPGGLPSQRQSWINKHLQFTHGYGAVLSPANAVTREGQPDFLVSNVPPESLPGAPTISQPELYFGENLGGYAVVNTDQGEIDYITSEGTDRTSKYQGDGGIVLDSPMRRAAMALRLREINLLISGSINDDSKAIFRRDVKERAKTAAPFLHYDNDPYPVVVEGRVKWVLDAYTTTAQYPYAERAESRSVPRGDLRGAGCNYIRNSLKVVIDAYDGSSIFYVVDDKDPLVKAYAKAFPKLFTSGDEVPDELRKHFRYPEDLFRIQTTAFANYHISSASDFYSKSDAWDVAQDPGSGKVKSGIPDASATTTPSQPGVATPLLATPREAKMDPYYLLMRLPEADKEEFLILQPFVPFSRNDSRKELTAFMVAKSDPDNYGDLEVFVMPRDQQIDGPAIIASRIQQSPDISEQITLLSQSGSEVLLGNLLVIPIGDSLIHVQPMYVQAKSTPVPEFKFAIVVYGDQVIMRPTLKEALTAIFGDAPETLEEGFGGAPPPDTTVPPPDGGVVVSATVLELLDQATAAFEAANKALVDGDLGLYQRKFREAQDLVARARAAGRATSSPTTTAPPPSDA